MYVYRKKITSHEGIERSASYWMKISSIFENKINEEFELISMGVTKGGDIIRVPYPVNLFPSFDHFL